MGPIGGRLSVSRSHSGIPSGGDASGGAGLVDALQHLVLAVDAALGDVGRHVAGCALDPKKTVVELRANLTHVTTHGLDELAEFSMPFDLGRAGLRLELLGGLIDLVQVLGELVLPFGAELFGCCLVGLLAEGCCVRLRPEDVGANIL